VPPEAETVAEPLLVDPQPTSVWFETVTLIVGQGFEEQAGREATLVTRNIVPALSIT
jgi:hypothetical protein